MKIKAVPVTLPYNTYTMYTLYSMLTSWVISVYFILLLLYQGYVQWDCTVYHGKLIIHMLRIK